MISKEENFAYIDGANLYKGINGLGWKLNYKRFRVWLSEKYGVVRAYIFIGLVAKYKELYTYLQEAGFTLVFKETIYDGDGKPNNKDKCSILLKRTDVPIAYLDDQRNTLKIQNEKAPDADGTA